MTNFNDGILLETERYVEGYLRDFLPKSRCFHSFDHTRAVVEACEMMASIYELSWNESEILYLAAWFHDTGYCRGRHNHEEESVKIASAFLDDYSTLPTGFYGAVNRLIRSTQLDRQPETLGEKILRDADLHHLGSSQYFIFAQVLKQELEWADGIKYTDREWTRNNINFLENHRFNTEYAVNAWEAQKQTNLLELKKLIGE